MFCNSPVRLCKSEHIGIYCFVFCLNISLKCYASTNLSELFLVMEFIFSSQTYHNFYFWHKIPGHFFLRDAVYTITMQIWSNFEFGASVPPISHLCVTVNPRSVLTTYMPVSSGSICCIAVRLKKTIWLQHFLMVQNSAIETKLNLDAQLQSFTCPVSKLFLYSDALIA